MKCERQRILRLLRETVSFASTMEVGSTAATGVVGKQDLDFALRVPSSRFYEAQSILDTSFRRNLRCKPVVGHQGYSIPSVVDGLAHLVILGGRYDYEFNKFINLLNENIEVRTAYNSLKRIWDGRSMHEYKAAKKTFIESSLRRARR
jgi:GrpB-like predicted nucleotidyltransferase (UPF0157 family)